MSTGDKRGLILYAHGARDPRWSAPFESLLAGVRERRPDVPVELAFLDYLEPDLATAALRLAELGVKHISIVPLFFGRGGHLRQDVPKQLELAQRALPAISFNMTEAAGEAPEIIDALADFALRGID